MRDQVPDEVKRERIERLIDVVQGVAAARNRNRVGGVEEVLVGGAEPYRCRDPPGPDAQEHHGQLHRECERRRAGRRRASRARARRRCAARSSRPLPPDVLAIFGPTASGKSVVAEELARRIPAELVSADAMQLYRGLPILTNQSEFPTRLVGILGLDEDGSVAEYQRLAHAAIDEILAAESMPIVVGGTGPLPARRSGRARAPAAAGSRRARAARSGSTTARRRRRARAPGRARPGGGRRGAPERPAARRPRARARRGRLEPASG